MGRSVAALLLVAMAGGARADAPLSAADVARFLRAGISEQTILTELKSRGFGEPLDATREATLREAGASETLMVAIRRVAPAPTPAREARRDAGAERLRAGGRGHADGCARADVRGGEPHRARARLGSRRQGRARAGPARRGLPHLGRRQAAGCDALQRGAPPAAPGAGARPQPEHGEQDPPGRGGAPAFHQPARADRRDPGHHVQRPAARRPGLHLRSPAARARARQPGGVGRARRSTTRHSKRSAAWRRVPPRARRSCW